MKTGFKSQCVPEYRLLNQAQIEEMHRATLKVLETIGVKVHHERALVLLRDAGGGKRYSEVVKQKTLEILASHKPKTLLPKTVKTLDGIYQTAGKILTEKFLSS